MRSFQEILRQKPWVAVVLFLATVAIGVGVGFLLSSVATRKAESRFAYTTAATIGATESRSDVWGEAYPLEYESWKRTAENPAGSQEAPTPTLDALAEDPRMIVLWAGYGFALDYQKPRGHAYSVEDIRQTLRTGAPSDTNKGPQPGTCWTCKSPDVPRMMAKIGADSFYNSKWADHGAEVVNPIGCLDCHDPKTMALRISRPGLVEAFQRQGKDITKASHSEMRSLVCAQCHVEYYFRPKDKYLIFPWDKGTTAEQMEAYYDSVQFTDWTHKLSRAPMIKAQHPDYEVFQFGIHAQRGISCADCHMPYRTEGGRKFSDHQIQSPLNNIANSCQVCHRESAEELRRNVEDRRDKVFESRFLLEDILVRAHLEAKAAWDAGADSATMKPILQLIRKAQWRWDFATAGNGNHFHAPLETSRILGNGIALGQEARLKLAQLLPKLGVPQEVPYPDIGNKDKAQKLVGIDRPKLEASKKVFLETMVPRWLRTAQEREAKLPK